MNKGSSWTALRNPAFRRLWIATLISGTCVAAQDSAATWIMNVATGSPFLISLMSTVASLPFFLFTLPAGALALHPDWLDRSNGARFSTKTFAQEVEPVHPVRPTSDGSDATPVLTRIYDKVPSPRTAIL
jgi:hypothetical protein